ncbi:MAG TPA: DUF2087 domain-containing protein [Micromonosporaceae bacterium]
MTAQALVGLLAEPTRMRVFAAIVLGASNPTEVAERTGLPARSVATGLRRLIDGGLVQTTEHGLTVEVAPFAEAARAERAKESAAPDPTEPAEDRFRATVLRAFVTDGRLVAIPVARNKRMVILEHVVTMFEPGVRYPEREVNALLRAWHPDHAALRRYLVDEQLLTRDQGVYWRIGGPTIS